MVTELLAFGGTLIGAVIWGVRQEGRITQQMTRVDDLKELISARFDGIEKTMAANDKGVDARLYRIERSLNGHLVKDYE